MIQPDEIIDKAQRLYPKAVTAILEASSTLQTAQSNQPSFFPIDALQLEGARVACGIDPTSRTTAPKEQSDRRLWIQRSISTASQSRPWRKRIPEAILIETMQDLVKLVRKSDEYRGLMKAVELIRAQFPQLESWIQSNWRKIIPAYEEIPHLLAVTQWLIANPRPNCFPREIPLAISTKLVETNWALLASWWTTYSRRLILTTAATRVITLSDMASVGSNHIYWFGCWTLQFNNSGKCLLTNFPFQRDALVN